MTEYPGWPDGYSLRRFDTIDSTNEEARRLAAGGEHGPLWLVAREQTGGRGRRGRAWVSQGGNLFATLLTTAALPTAAQLSFTAGLAVAEALEPDVVPGAIALKWPNDVLLNGRKIAGILLESCGADRIAIGVGINLAKHPEDTEFPATSIAAETKLPAPDPEETLARLASRMAAWYDVWRRDGFGRVRTAWLLRAAGLGTRIMVRLADREMTGVFEDLNEEGALIVRDSSGSRTRVTAGDVFFPG